MNERIRKLAKQAGFGLHRDGEIYTSRLEHLPITEDIEKFAELIVQECADVAKETRWAVPPSQEQIARGIQQHFGIEE